LTTILHTPLPSSVPRLALEAYHEALGAIKKIADLEGRITTMQAIGDLHLRFEHDDRAYAMYRSAYKLLASSRQTRQSVPRATRALLVSRLQRVRRRQKRNTLAQALAEVVQIMEEDGPGSPRRQQLWAGRLAKAHEYLADTRYDQGKLAEAAEHYGACLRLAKAHRLRMPLATLFAARAFALLQHGDHRGASEAYAAEVRLRRRQLARAEKGNSSAPLKAKARRGAQLKLADACTGLAEAHLAAVAVHTGGGSQSEGDLNTAAAQLEEATQLVLAAADKFTARPKVQSRLKEIFDKVGRVLDNAELDRSGGGGDGGGGGQSALSLLRGKIRGLLTDDPELAISSDDDEEADEEACTFSSGESGDDEAMRGAAAGTPPPATTAADVSLAALLPEDCPVRSLPSEDEEGDEVVNSDGEVMTALELTDSDPEREAKEAARRTQRERQRLLRRNELGETPLQQAARKGQVNLVRDLLNKGAPINARDNAGWTPLHDAVRKGSPAIVNLILAKEGVEVDACSKPEQGGLAPLHDASEVGHLDIVKSLLAAKASVLVTDARGRTPLDVAAEEGQDEVFAELRRAFCCSNGDVQPEWRSKEEYLAQRRIATAAVDDDIGMIFLLC
jgi:tetratricopeptide (TPR) repeat protein